MKPQNPLPPHDTAVAPWDRRPIAWRAGIVAGIAVLAIFALFTDVHDATRRLLLATPAGRGLLLLAAAYALAGSAMWVARIVLVLGYRPVPSPDDDALPSVTVLVPAFNEGPLVADTLRSLAASHYPPDRLQIIAIDDGSADDTWDHIRRAADELAPRVHALRCRRNRGKRHALFEGFTRARGDIFITVDSDSVVEADTLRNLVAPFVADPAVGAVAGNVRVLNRSAGLIPLLMSVQFVLSFDFVRAAQSRARAVLCTPGALSAYRAAAARPLLDRWMKQRWLGRPCNNGEDRAMTNMILSCGWRTMFQSSARVWTKMPVRYRGLRRMLTRWARSNVRESVQFAKFAFGPFRPYEDEWRILLTRVYFVVRTAGLLLTPLLMAATLALAPRWPLTVGLHLLAAAVTGSLWSMAVCVWRSERKSDALFAAIYSLLWLVGIWWIQSWALATSHQNVWLTRGAARPSVAGRLAGAWRSFRRRTARELRRAVLRALPRPAEL